MSEEVDRTGSRGDNSTKIDRTRRSWRSCDTIDGLVLADDASTPGKTSIFLLYFLRYGTTTVYLAASFFPVARGIFAEASSSSLAQTCNREM